MSEKHFKKQPQSYSQKHALIQNFKEINQFGKIFGSKLNHLNQYSRSYFQTF
jgi:hypothetical protein